VNLAFKDADLAGGFFSKAIKWKTGGRFSHVELWMTGPRENAVCFSSREPNGTGYATIDLSPPLWTCVEILATPAQMMAVSWFAEGTGFKRYDFLGILGFVIHHREHDPASVFCSEWCTLVLQRCLGLFLKDKGGQAIQSWEISPSALYEMALIASEGKV
jgi:hypothetical protein